MLLCARLRSLAAVSSLVSGLTSAVMRVTAVMGRLRFMGSVMGRQSLTVEIFRIRSPDF